VTRYRLADALGGGGVDMIDTPRVVDGAPVRTDSGDVLLIPMKLLTAVPPPEPPVGAYAIGGLTAVRLETGPAGCTWFTTGEEGRPYRWSNWAELWDRTGGPEVAVVPLVPDPFAEPVVLPWRHDFTDGGPIHVRRSTSSNRAAYVEGWGHLTADEARAMARALWATS